MKNSSGSVLCEICGLALSYCLFGAAIPASPDNVWLLSGLAGILFGTLLITPFFTPPADTISYVFTGIIVFISGGTAPPEKPLVFYLWMGATIYLLFLLAVAMGNILIKDRRGKLVQTVAQISYDLNDWLGRPQTIFSVVVGYAIVAFHLSNPTEAVAIGIVWLVIAFGEPLQQLWTLGKKYYWSKSKRIASRVGRVIRHETPNVVLINDDGEKKVSPNDLLIARTEEGHFGIAMAIDHVGYIDGRWLRAVHFEEPQQWLQEELSNFHDIEPTEVYDIEIAPGVVDKIHDNGFHLLEKKDHLIGVVSKHSDLSNIKIDVTATDIDLQEGMLVETEIHGESVLYQLMEGVTHDEIIEGKNKRGHVIAEANKLGVWDSEKNGFDRKEWLPTPNTPVFVSSDKTVPKNSETKIPPVGTFPNSAYPVYIESLDKLVTHNTAILGILGVGKTYLSIELIERMLNAGIKVVCLDITGQYKEMLKPYRSAEVEDKFIRDLNEVGEKGEGKTRRNQREGGSRLEFQKELEEKFEVFLDENRDEMHLLVLDPSQLTVWEQISGEYSNDNGEMDANMDTLSPAQITRDISGVVLDILKKQGQSSCAKCCIVLEEAHSLIPERNSTSERSDSEASAGTAKAIMQGRKFGLGCMVITQRTANVTKSILNQCNTMFAMRVYDSSGMEFVKKYIGEKQVETLSELDDQQAIIYGKGSSCDDPILVRLNKRKAFLEEFSEFRGSVEVDGESMLSDWSDGQEVQNEKLSEDGAADQADEYSEDEIPF